MICNISISCAIFCPTIFFPYLGHPWSRLLGDHPEKEIVSTIVLVNVIHLITLFLNFHLRWSSRTLGSVCWAEGSSSNFKPSIWGLFGVSICFLFDWIWLFWSILPVAYIIQLKILGNCQWNLILSVRSGRLYEGIYIPNWSSTSAKGMSMYKECWVVHTSRNILWDERSKLSLQIHSLWRVPVQEYASLNHIIYFNTCRIIPLK